MKNYRSEIASKYKCTGCTTDLKKYQEYAIESTMNSIRAAKYI